MRTYIGRALNVCPDFGSLDTIVRFRFLAVQFAARSSFVCNGFVFNIGVLLRAGG